MLSPLVLMGLVGTLLLFWRGSGKSLAFTAMLFLLLGLLSIFYYAANYFTGAGITDAVLFHLSVGPEGAGLEDFMDLWIKLVLAFFALLGFLIWTIIRFRIKSAQHILQPACETSRKSISLVTLTAPLLATVSLAVHPTTIDGMTLWSQYHTESELSDVSEFVKPIKLESRTGKQKNLVYLYLESVERTFFDQKKFPGLITHLRELEKSALSFHGLLQAPMTGWTIAGMTASQCGIPISTFNTGKNASVQANQFLPGSTCLGDLLKNEGYYLAYVGGADLKFAGKGNFYRTHGFDEVMGLHEVNALRGGNLPKSEWGIYDDVTLDVAYSRFEKLSQSEKPFGLISLTLDTHPPRGHVTPACSNRQYGDGSNKMLNAIHCADYLAASFIRRILASPYARDTVLVVGSDHFVLSSDATPMVQAPGGELPRNNLFMVFDSDQPPRVVSRKGTTLDIAPTLLDVLGYRADEFAMGRNLLANNPTMVEKFGFGVFASKVEHWRMDLWKYWNPQKKEG